MIPAVVAFALQIFFIDESPRWLAINDRHDHAITILNKIASANKAEPLNDDE